MKISENVDGAFIIKQPTVSCNLTPILLMVVLYQVIFFVAQPPLREDNSDLSVHIPAWDISLRLMLIDCISNLIGPFKLYFFSFKNCVFAAKHTAFNEYSCFPITFDTFEVCIHSFSHLHFCSLKTRSQELFGGLVSCSMEWVHQTSGTILGVTFFMKVSFVNRIIY